MPLREDLVTGHRMRDASVGSAITRTFHVTGLTAPPAEQIREARYFPGIPAFGDAYPATHPGLPASNLRVTSYDLTPYGPDAVKVEVSYTPPGTSSGGTWNQPTPVGDGVDVKQVSSSLRERVTTRDVGDNAMVLTPPATKTLAQPYLSEARIFEPVGSLVLERVESEPPTARLRAYVGKVNSGSLAGGIYQARTLLFAGFDAQSEDGGISWRVTYQFDYDPLEWQHRDTWRDEGGKPPDDAVELTWNVLPTANFAALDLDFSDSQTPI